VDRSGAALFRKTVYKEISRPPVPLTRIQPFLAKAMVVREAIEAKRLPPRLCPTNTCARAKNCALLVSCFSRRTNSVGTVHLRS
jgi:hypothetical protein